MISETCADTIRHPSGRRTHVCVCRPTTSTAAPSPSANDPLYDGLAAPVRGDAATLFSDVPVSNPFYSDIYWMSANGITTGYGDGTYQPATVVERQAAAAFLYRMATANPPNPLPSCGAAPFLDVPVSNPFCWQIAWMKTNHIATGDAVSNFDPTGPTGSLTRQAAAAFLYRYDHPGAADATCGSQPFTDVPVTNPFCGDIAWMASSGITTATGTFNPGGSVDRESMAAFLRRSYTAFGWVRR